MYQRKIIKNPKSGLLTNENVLSLKKQFSKIDAKNLEFDEDAGTIVFKHYNKNEELFRGIQKGRNGPWICRWNSKILSQT